MATVYEGHFDTPKTRRSARTIPLGPKALSILSVLHKRTHDSGALVFSTRSGEPLCRRNLLHRHLRLTRKKLGLPRMAWHSLRCHATLLDAAGAPLGTGPALLGHSSPQIARQIYLQAIPAEQRRLIRGQMVGGRGRDRTGAPLLAKQA